MGIGFRFTKLLGFYNGSWGGGGATASLGSTKLSAVVFDNCSSVSDNEGERTNSIKRVLYTGKPAAKSNKVVTTQAKTTTGNNSLPATPF